MAEHILTEVAEGIGRISINRVARHNSLVPAVMAEITAAITAFGEDDQVRAIVLTGEGPDFSVGGDFDELYAVTKLTPSEIRDTLYKYFAGGVRAIYDCDKPTVAAVRGFAYGAACEMAIACDFRVVSETAKLCETWSNIGLAPALGGMFMVPNLLGRARAAELLLLGDPVSGQEALAMGLATKLVADIELEGASMALAARLAAKPPLAMRVIKEGIRKGLESDFAAAQMHGLYAQATLLKSGDYLEAINALREKRPARFSGV